MNVNRLQEGLCTKRFGKRIIFLREIGSTNDLAKELASYGADEGTVVVAEKQTSGRGRLGREWVSPKGGLYFSIVLRPKLGIGDAVKLVFVAGLAVAEVLHELYGLRVDTKWPNDVLVNGKKTCGVLSEMNTTGEKVNYAIVGIGVNANINIAKEFPEQLTAVSASLEGELGRKVRLEELLRALLEKLEEIYKRFLKEGFTSVLEKWKKYAGFLGQQVEVTSETEKLRGFALDVDSDGALILKLEDGTLKRIFVGDVSLRIKGDCMRFVVGCEFDELERHLDRLGVYKEEGEREKLETKLRNGLFNLIVWRKNGEIIGHAIWHESNTEEHRKGDPRDEEDIEALRKLLGGKKDFVELHEIWLLAEHRGKGYGKKFFEFFEEYMRSKGYDKIVFYAHHPAALAICRKRGYKEGGSVCIDGVAEYVFYLPLRK